MKKWYAVFLISLFIHATLFIAIQGGEGQGGEGDGSGNGLVKFSPSVIIDKMETSKAPGKDCPNWFGGIGITITRGGYEIIKVHAGYPAHKAGIRVGDRIISNYYDVRGEPGTSASIQIDRDGQILNFNMIRERVCVNGE